MLKTIKSVDETTWTRFKSLAARRNIKMGILLKLMVEEYERKSKKFWAAILLENKILSDIEAEDLKKSISKIRKEYGFRT